MIFVHDTPTNRLLNMVLGGGSPVAEYTATGNPLTFTTDLAKPLKSLLIPFTPIQSGTGDPSPENIRPILPRDGLSVQQTGKNLFDKTNGTEGFVWWTGNLAFGYDDFFATNKIPVVPGAKYTLKKDVTGQNQCELFDINGNYVSQNTNMMGLSVSMFTIPDGVYFIAFNINKAALDTAQLEVGQTATAYEPYKPITATDIVFPSPVYGGTLDVVSGVLTVTHALLTKNTASMNNEEGYPGWKNSGIRALIGEGLSGERDGILNIGTKFSINTKNNNDVLFLSVGTYGKTQDEWIALALDVQIAVPLAVPQTIQLTPEQITALIGNNTIWSDADGDMTAVYLKKG